MFSYGGDDTLRWIKNPPGSLNEEAFIRQLEAATIDGVSQRSIKQAMRQVRHSNEPFYGEVTLVIDGKPRRFEVSLNPHTNQRILGVANDLGERGPNDEAVRQLSLELAHRTKNLMAVISSLAVQTGRRIGSVKDFTKYFVGQIGALSRAHDAIAGTGWRGALLSTVVEAIVVGQRRENGVTVKGDLATILLSPNATQNVAMALHELVTHCDEDGGIEVAVAVADEDMLELSLSGSRCAVQDLMWTDLLEKVIPMALGGAADLTDENGGLSYRFTIAAEHFSIV